MIILALDLAVIGIVLFCGWRGYKNGLIRGVFGVVSLALCLFLANVASTAYSGEFKEMLSPFVGGIIDTALVEVKEEEIGLALLRFKDESDDFIKAYAALRHIGLPESAAARVAEQASEEPEEPEDDIAPAGFLSNLLSEKLSSTLAFVAVFGIAFLLLAIVFSVVGNLVGFIFSLPGLKMVDITAGALLGLAKGFIIAFALASVIRYAGLLAPETLYETSVLKYFVNNNPIADIIGI